MATLTQKIELVVTAKIAELPPAKSAYDLYVDSIDSGQEPLSEEEWLESLHGTDGYTPIKGVDYNDGLQGNPGYTPIKGVDYFDGDKGDQGNPGTPGSDATVTKSNVEAVLTGEISSHSHAGTGSGLTQQQIEGLI